MNANKAFIGPVVLEIAVSTYRLTFSNLNFCVSADAFDPSWEYRVEGRGFSSTLDGRGLLYAKKLASIETVLLGPWA